MAKEPTHNLLIGQGRQPGERAAKVPSHLVNQMRKRPHNQCRLGIIQFLQIERKGAVAPPPIVRLGINFIYDLIGLLVKARLPQRRTNRFASVDRQARVEFGVENNLGKTFSPVFEYVKSLQSITTRRDESIAYKIPVIADIIRLPSPALPLTRTYRSIAPCL